MLKEYNKLFKVLFSFCDLFVVFSTWLLVYYIGFKNSQLYFSKGLPTFEQHLILFIAVVGIHAICFSIYSLHDPKRITSIRHEIWNIFKASFIAIIFSILIFYLINENRYSLSTFLLLGGMSFSSLSIFRVILRRSLRHIRRRGYNRRFILIVGTGKLARNLYRKMHTRKEFGLHVIGYLSNNLQDINSSIDGIKLLGSYEDINNVINDNVVDQVIFALPQSEYETTLILMEKIADTIVDIYVAPDIQYSIHTLRHGIEDIDGIPILKLRETPLLGWNKFIKRCFDFSIALFILVFTFPLMLIIGILIKIESPGHIFYKQERVGYDGNIFEILKFRSMRRDAEEKNGAVWAEENDPRRTRIGKILRRTSLDELPQFINVLKGEMSIVGPRPERPIFIEKFRKEIPKYMLRHKTKAGITGLAQINGYRGNTSLEQRIEYDIYYIEHWSIWLDIDILFKTIPALFKGDGAY